MDDLFGNVIFSYTRQDAIDDGVLVDVSKMAREAGFKIPVAVTQAVWEQYITPDPRSEKYGQSIDGRLWDTLWMLHVAISTKKSSSEIHYQCIYVLKEKQRKTVTLKAMIHPGDNMEPVVTIMLPNED